MSGSPQLPVVNSESTSTAAGAEAAAIQAVSLTKVFGDRVCVDHLSFSVQPGELYALLGDNGAGKTTTINMLTTLLQPTSGQALICGFDVTRQSEKAKAAFSVVSQEVALYGELTAYENLAFIADLYGIPQKEARSRIGEILAGASLAERAHDLVGTFSTGMQRRLSIAIAMLRQPKVIFMDEPTVGLDPGARHHIWEDLLTLKARGVTVLLTTHYLEEAQFLADRIGIIRQGKLVIEGTIDELRNHITATRTISVFLSDSSTPEDVAERLKRFKGLNAATVSFDSLRDCIMFTPPSDCVLSSYVADVVTWLKEEELAYDQFATTEPSLEEIFLYIQSGKAQPTAKTA